MKQKGSVLTRDEYKGEIKNILAFFHNFCNENNIHYYIDCGSLLGTIRHKGFIPWDDDIDVCMKKEDYDKFASLISENRDYYILSSASSEYYYNNFPRLCSRTCRLKLSGVVKIDNLGAFIDIFPLYNVPADDVERRDFYRRIQKARADIMYSLPITYYSTCTIKSKLHVLCNVPRRIICRYIIGTKRLKEKRDEIMATYQDKNTGLYGDLFDGLDDSLLVKPEEIESFFDMSFEDIIVKVPNGYDSILNRMFGDYMTPPPELQRISHHHFTPYWCE